MTAQQLAYACLEYIGEMSITLVEYSAQSAGVFRAILRSINEAQQEIFELNPALFKREVGIAVAAPITGTIGVTNGSTAVGSFTFTGASAPSGNTILIAGQSEYNAIRTEGASKKLLFPYTGTTGTQAATLYGDCILLDSAFSRPLSPVWLSDIRVLAPIAGKAEYLGYDPRQDLNGDWGRLPYGVTRSPLPRLVAQPEAYFADTHLLEAGTSQTWIHLTPIPDRAFSLRFDAAVRPLTIVAADYGSEGTDPGKNFGLPAGNDEKFLLPLVLYRWSRSAFFKNDDARKQLAADYAALLPQIENWKVQTQTGGHILTGGWR